MINFENLDKALYYSDTKYQIPIIEPLELNDADVARLKNIKWIPFSDVMITKDTTDKGVHFFIDDYRFIRVWNQPDRYIQMLKKYDFVLTPDFSTYTDMPVAMQIYNTYRKNWIGKYMQDNGINVIPTVSWSKADNNDWIFDGIPKHSVIAISTLGCMKDKRATELFYEGWRTAQRKLQPSLVFCYGKIPQRFDGKVIEMGKYSYFRKNEKKG